MLAMTRRLGKRIGNRMQREMPLSESASKKHAEIITRGLVIDKSWVDLIVDGKKIWEMRTRIGLVAKGGQERLLGLPV